MLAHGTCGPALFVYARMLLTLYFSAGCLPRPNAHKSQRPAEGEASTPASEKKAKKEKKKKKKEAKEKKM